jgi:hypothetical protein
MRLDADSKRFGGRVRRPLLSLSSFLLAIAVGIISSFTFSAAYDMARSALGVRPQVSGLWRAYWKDVPAATIRLEQQGDQLGGTVSFNRIYETDEGFRSEESAPEIPLVNPRLEGKRLLFELQAPDDIRPKLLVEMEIYFENEDKASLRCVRRNSLEVPVDEEPAIGLRRERSF